jgi:hypothetical protein
MKIKVEKRFRSVDEVLRDLLGIGAEKAVETTPEEGESDSSSTGALELQPSQSRVVDAATESRPTQLADSPAGANAAPPPKKYRWSFCPQCLNMYDHQGKCPSCGADLVPLDSEESKRLYVKLKGERGMR